MSTPYHPAYQPPFPQATVVLSVENERAGPFAALLDTGAESEKVTIRSHFGESRQLQSYLVEVQANGLLLSGLYVVGDDQGDEIILGRDVLNKLPLLLDGPALQTEILDDATATRLRAKKRP